MGYPVITFSDDPIAIAGFHDDNSRNSAPRNGLRMEFSMGCGAMPSAGNAKVRLYLDYRPNDLWTQSDYDNCPNIAATKEGQLNRVIIKLSQTHVDLYISDYSNDGINFGTPKLVESKNYSLPFSRGYVLLGGHNHATIKYSGSYAPGGVEIPSWTVLWDNIAFDGPVITPDRIYQFPDSLVPSGSNMDMGYYLPGISDPLMTPLSVNNVNLSGITSAKLSLIDWFNYVLTPISQMKLNYRLNNGTWHSVGFSAGQQWAMSNPYGEGICCNYNVGHNNMVFDVNPVELVNGTNTVQFQNVGMDSGYRPVIANIDLLLR